MFLQTLRSKLSGCALRVRSFSWHAVPRSIMCRNHNVHTAGGFENSTLIFTRKSSFEESRSNTALRIKDNIPEDFQLIYKTGLDNYIVGTQAYAAASTAILATLGLYKHSSDLNLVFPESLNMGEIVGGDFELYVFSFGFLLMNLAILITAEKFPLRIYFDKSKEKYIAVFSHVIPYKTKHFLFNKGDVETGTYSNSTPWKNIFFRMAGKRVLLLENSFRTNADLENMLK